MTLEDRLRDWGAARGYGLAVADIGVVETVRRKLEERRASGMIDAGFFEENLTKFRYLEGASITGPAWVVMLAVPSPISVLPVTIGSRTIDTLIPPTYVRYNATFEDVLADMKANALPTDVEAAVLKAPLKSLAVHMGLVVYGRNNITYRPGLGSGHQLCGYLVGTTLGTGARPSDPRRPETMLERCLNCRACLRACPTGAIREDRFLIAAERCFTLHSESHKPIPAWVKPPRSICLIGCMACQQVCPENQGRLKMVRSGMEFTAEETAAVIAVGRGLTMNGPSAGDVAKARTNPAFVSARTKFDDLGMSEDIEVMGRNLGYFLSL
jgi:epoxyqueuosine reductase